MSDDEDISFSVAMCRSGFRKDRCAIKEQHIGYRGCRRLKNSLLKEIWSSFLCDECGYLYDAEASPESLKERARYS